MLLFDNNAPIKQKQWINTKVEFEWSEELQKYVEISTDGYWYDGDMALCLTTVEDSSYPILSLEDNASTAWGRMGYYPNDKYLHLGAYDDSYIMQIHNNGAVQKVVTKAAYNWNIGAVTTPTGKFQVVSASLGSVTMLEGAVGGAPGAGSGMLNVTTNQGGGKWATQMRADSGTANGLFVRAGADSSYYTTYMTGYDENNVHMVVRGDGNVGIGTSAPSASLSVGAGASSVHGELLISADDGLHNYIRFTNGGGGESHYPSGIWYAPSANMELRAANSSTTSNVAQLVLAANSNVGIGTTSPDGNLTVASSGVTNFEVESTAAYSTAPSVAINGVLKYNAGGAKTNFGKIVFGKLNATDAHTAGYTAFYKKPAGETYAEAMRIDPDGNVGIGTATPAGIMGDTNDPTPLLHIKGGRPGFVLEDTDDNLDFEVTANAGFNIYDATNSALRFVIDSSGDVGIGAASPSYKLEVAGTFYSAGSSVAYKENIEDLEVDSSLIHSLRPVSYDYKKKYKDFGYNVKDGKQIGLISEEVAEIIPELAIMKDGKPMNVDYQKLAVVLLAEVQNLKRDIEELKEI